METTTLSTSDIEALRQVRGLKPHDSSDDEAILALSKSDQLRLILQWNGLIGWGNTVEHLVERIWGITL